jgi:L-lactate dehydrogenase complex protein LldG
MSSARNNILNRVATALAKRTEVPFPDHVQTSFAFPPNEKDLVGLFTKEFTALDGHVIFCRERSDLLENITRLVAEKKWAHVACTTPALLGNMQLGELPYINKVSAGLEADAGITDCECLVARTATVVLSSAQASGRVLPVYSPVHLVIASVDDLVFDIGDALRRVESKYKGKLPSALFFASGPSRTADIEKRLVLGVHGPKEVYLFLMQDRINQ